ncbi:hypothetical protein [Phocoenobacter skyensis]|uniref:hypothetical protein n=1 Tax=Phocoenobacter skyensis TaxID=97481 RepID=UPI0027632FAA|nr:hypothetical protein [Pasteurella skyensis]MDP8185324.1 hypothetical protein [Pasteurella skyensis]
MSTNKFHRLFEATPSLKNGKVTSAEVQVLLNQFVEKIKQNGSVSEITVYPHRVFNKVAWRLKIKCEEKTLNILLNISGVFQLPTFDTDTWPARLVIEMIDNVDAVYFIRFIAEKCNLAITIPHIDYVEKGKGEHNECK